MISDLYLHLFSNGTWARLRKWDGRSKFSTWLAAVARNLYAERVRTRSHGGARFAGDALSSTVYWKETARDQPMVAMADQEVQTFQNSRILRAMELLSDRDRLIVSLLDLKVPPEKIEVVAEMLDRTIEAVRVAHTRAKQRLPRGARTRGGSAMTDLRGDHPTIEDLAAFAEGNAWDTASIEAHLDGCESCTLEVIAAREAIAFESLGFDRAPISRAFGSRGPAATRGHPRTQGIGCRWLKLVDGMGATGFLGGIAGLGFLAPGPDLVLAADDHPDEGFRLFPQDFPKQGEIPEGSAPSDSSGDEISRMLDHLRAVLGGETSDHPGGPTGLDELEEDPHAHASEPDEEGSADHPGHDLDASELADDHPDDHPWDHDHEDLDG